MNTTTTTLDFPIQVRNNVHFMLAAFAELTDSTLSRLDDQRGNLLMAVEFGLNYPETVEETGKLMAMVYPLIERRGYIHSWLPVMRRAVQLVSTPLLRLRLQSQLGHLLSIERRLDEAIQVLSEIVNTPTIAQDQLLAARAHFRLGNAYYEKADLTTAEEHAREALSYFHTTRPEMESSLHQGLVNNLMGQIDQQRGRHEQAIQFFQAAIHFFASCGDITYLAGAYSNIGFSKQELQSYSEAIDYYQEALDLLTGTTSEFQKCRVYLALGDVYYDIGDWDRSEAAWKAANSPFMQQSGNNYLLGFVVCNLALIKIKREAFEAAIELLNEADHLWMDGEADMYRGHALETKAKAYEKLGELDKALVACNQAERLLSRFPEFEWAQERLADTHRRQKRLRQQLDAR